MKNTFAKHTFHAVVLAMALSPTLAMAQKRDDIFPSSAISRSCRIK